MTASKPSFAHTAISCGASRRFGFFTFAGPNSEPAASPAVSATPGSRDTMAATIAPSINSASWCASAFRLGRAHFAGELFDMRQHHLLVPHRDGAELLLVLVVFADRVDEGAAVKSLLAEPAFQRRKDSREFCLRVAAALFHRADEPFAPLLAFALQHGMHEIGFRAEQFVERGFCSAGFVDDGVDAGGVDAVLAKQMRRCAEQAPARQLVVAGNGAGGRLLLRS